MPGSRVRVPPLLLGKVAPLLTFVTEVTIILPASYDNEMGAARRPFLALETHSQFVPANKIQ
jgi:hypothetical protein